MVETHWRLATMTEDTRKSLYWTSGITAGVILVVAVLWLAGVFDAVAVQ